MQDVYAKLPGQMNHLSIPNNTASEITVEARAVTARCEKVITYCTLVRQHVVEYDSLDTAATILGRAINICPSIEAREFLVKANKLLRAAIKAAAWLQSRRRKKHVDVNTRTRNLDRFHDELSEAIVRLETEGKRNSSSLIDYISANFETDLPLTLPASRTFMVRKIPIVVMLPDGVKIDATIPTMQIDGKLWLLKQAHVIGVNTDKVKQKEYDTVNNTVLRRYGCTVYETALRRPSSNVNWYLLLDFHATVLYAGFVDYLEIDTPHALAETKLKTERLRTARVAFEHDFAELFRQVSWLRARLDNAVADASFHQETFSNLTALSDVEAGLSVTEYKRLREHLFHYRENLLRNGVSVTEAKRQTLYQRLAARVAYYDAQFHAGLAKHLRAEIAATQRQINLHRDNRALSLGMVGTRSLMDLPAE